MGPGWRFNVYFGEAVVKLDDKGRMTVPRRVRQTMEVHGHALWYMTRGFDGCISLYHRDEWNKIVAQVNRFSSMHAKASDFRRLFFSSLAEVKPDGQGRMAVAPHLRELAGLENEAVLIGAGDHLEIWSKDRWRAFQTSNEDAYKEMATLISTGGGLEALGQEAVSGQHGIGAVPGTTT